jgi:hypothetical protein
VDEPGTHEYHDSPSLKGLRRPEVDGYLGARPWLLGAVVANGLDGAAFHRFLAELLFVLGSRLLVNVGIAAVVVAAEIARGRFAAQIAVDALIVDVVLAGQVFRIAICDVSHKRRWKHIPVRRGRNVFSVVF